MNSVINPQKKILFCEGQDESLDFKILERLSGNLATVIPVGGKRSFGSFIEGYLSGFSGNLPAYIALRDRDFDAEPPDTIQLIIPEKTPKPDRKPIFYTYRACIENYLLDANLIDTYWSERAKAPKWQYGESPGIEAINHWIECSAEKIADYQAIRWALASLKPSQRWPEVKTTWTKGSGYLPSSLEKELCLSEANKLIVKFKETVELVQPESFTENLENYSDRFQTSGFWENKQYLVWFHGKDLKKAMQKEKETKNPKWISLKSFFEWATGELDIENHPDLRELKHKIEEL